MQAFLGEQEIVATDDVTDGGFVGFKEKAIALITYLHFDIQQKAKYLLNMLDNKTFCRLY